MDTKKKRKKFIAEVLRVRSVCGDSVAVRSLVRLTDRPTAGNMPRPSAAFSALLLLLVTGASAAPPGEWTGLGSDAGGRLRR